MSETDILDARRLLCPLPVIRVQQRINQLAPGSILTVRATDRGVLHDIPAWCRIHGHSIKKIEQTHQEIRLEIEVKA